MLPHCVSCFNNNILEMLGRKFFRFTSTVIVLTSRYPPSLNPKPSASCDPYILDSTEPVEALRADSGDIHMKSMQAYQYPRMRSKSSFGEVKISCVSALCRWTLLG